MEVTIHIDDSYMGKMMADIHESAEDCAREALGMLRWAIDVKRSGKVLCTCDRNGMNLQMANVPVLERVDR